MSSFLGRLVLSTCLASAASNVVTAVVLPFKRDLSDLGSQLSPNAAIYTSNSSEFANATARWTTWSAPTFKLVIEPATEQDVATSVQYATNNSMSFLAQGGGHGYSGTLEVIQQAVQINLKQFNTTTFNAADNTITVGGGIPFSQLAAIAYDNSRELTVGSCPCVGVVGAALAGGHGRLQGVHGLSQDAFKSMRMVLANGTIINVSATEHPDLWWGMRGAGQNFGIVVSATFNTYPQTNSGLNYDAEMGFTGDKLEDIVNYFNEQLPSWPAELAIDFSYAADPTTKDPVIVISLIYAGPESEGRTYANALNAFGPTRFTENIYNFGELNYKAAGGSIAASCVKGFKRSTFSLFADTFDLPTMQDAWNGWVEFLDTYPDASGSGHLWEIFGTQAIHAVPSNSSAYANRPFVKIMWLLQFAWTDPSIEGDLDSYGKTWRSKYQNASGYANMHTYTNYARGDEPLEALFGYKASRLDRLRSLKAAYDPDNVFDGYHGVVVN